MPTQEELRAKWNAPASQSTQEELRAKWSAPAEPVKERKLTLRETMKKNVLDREAKMSDQTRRMQFGYDDVGVGAKQLAGHGASAVNRAFGGEGIEAVDEYDQYVKDREASYQGPADGGFDFARMGGSMVNPISMAGPGKFGKAATGAKYLLQRGGAHAAANAGQGAMMPSTSDEYWSDKGSDALIGAAVGTGIAGGGKLAGELRDLKAKNFADESGLARTYLGDLFGEENLTEVANILRNLKGSVPGEKPTAAWGALAESGKYPGLASLEHNARIAKTGGAFNQRDAQNKASQLRAMNEVIGEGEDMFNITPGKSYGKSAKTPIQQRTSETVGPMYDRAAPERIDLTGEQARAIKLAQNEDVINLQQANIDAGFATGPSVGRADAGEIIDGEIISSPSDTIGSMQAKRQAIDAQITAGKNATDSAALANLANLQNTRKGITGKLRESDAFREADDTFSEMIAPQNRADYMKVLRSAATDEGGGSSQLLKAIDDAQGTGRKAGIPIRIDSTAQVMRPSVEGGQDAMNTVDALRASARRDVDVGRVTNTKLGEVTTIGDAVDKFIPPLLNPVITSSKRFLKFIGGKSEEQVQQLLNKAALDPSLLADLVSDIPPEQRNAVVNWVRSFNKKAGQSVRSGAVHESVRDEE